MRGRKLTQEEFIEKAKSVHGDKYDYSEINYVNNRTKIKIICKEHGEFFQSCYTHIYRGQGCPQCANLHCGEYHKLNNDSFIQKARKIHGNRYDYSKIKYINNYTKIEIICKEHGSFWQIPTNHLKGRGCSLCANLHRGEYHKLNNNIFIEKSKEVHNDKYDYSKVNYVNNSTKVEIICKEHGSFWQIPSYHMMGGECCKCLNRITNFESFIQKSKKLHQDKYNYSKVEYKKSNIKVCIICSKHGEFWQTPNNHLSGKGCPHCNMSKGEMKVRNWLIEHNIEFEEQKRFDDCKDERLLPFDFYIPSKNLCIEFDGKQHFEFVNFTGKMTDEEMKNNLEECNKRDKIKTNYCLTNNIKLIRIRYNENVEEKLEELCV